MSSNPFRRSQHPPAPASPPQSRTDSFFPLQLDDADSSSTPPRVSKTVHISSPPQSPSAAGSEVQDALVERIRRAFHSGSPPPQMPEEALHAVGGRPADPFEWAAATAEAVRDEELIRNTRRNSGPLQQVTSPSGAPPNPFSRTLATLESSGPEKHVQFKEGILHDRPVADKLPSGAPRASLDVDAFKRLLMTGSTSTSPAAGTAPPRPAAQQSGHTESGSSTDASSVSRQSLFEPVQETLVETPRTSFEVSRSEDDDGHVGLLSETSKVEKKKSPPALPKHRHGKLVTSRTPQTVSFSDFATSIPSPTSIQSPPGQRTRRSDSDLNKPLPPKPRTSSVNKEGTEEGIAPPQSQVQDRKEPTTPPKGPDPPSPTGSLSTPRAARLPSTDSDPSPAASVPQQKRAPPPVPLARRQSQLRNSSITQTQRSRSSSSLTINSQYSIESGTIPPPSTAAAGATSHKSLPPPPPPPTRRHGAPIAGATSSAGNSIVDVPAISRPKAPSLTSPISPPLSQQQATMNPPPPPPRRNRGSSRSSLELHRDPIDTPRQRSSLDTKRLSRDSGKVRLDISAAAPPPPPREGRNREDSKASNDEGPPTSVEEDHTPSSDVLADMERFQREVDELRQQYSSPR